MSSYFELPSQVSKILTIVTQTQQQVSQLQQEMRQVMSEDATIAAEAAAEETSITSIGQSLQGLLAALGNEQGLSPATLAAAAQVQTDLANLATTAQSDVPPAAPAAPAS